MIAEKALSDTLKRTLRRILEGGRNILRESTPEETERWRQAHESQEAKDARAEHQHQEDVKRRLAVLQEQFEAAIQPLATRVAAREIAPAHFRGLMAIEIRHNLLTGAAIGAGGIGRLTPGDIARADARFKEEMGYLDNWIAQLERQPDDQARSAAALQVRASLYGQSGALIAQETLDQNRFQDFPALPFYPKQRTLCKRHCACGWEWQIIDRKKGDANVYWRLDYTRKPIEHCETCLNRAEVFSPLMIRDFRFTNLPTDLTRFLA